MEKINKGLKEINNTESEKPEDIRDYLNIEGSEFENNYKNNDGKITNEAIEEVSIKKGDFIYLEKKATKGPAEMKGSWHKIAQGETMYSIAQKYGIRLAALYRMNYKDEDYDPYVGDILRVR